MKIKVLGSGICNKYTGYVAIWNNDTSCNSYK